MLIIHRNLLKLFIVLILILKEINSHNHHEDLYSSIPALEKIFETESYLLENLENYIVKSENSIDLLKSHLIKMKKQFEFSQNTGNEPISMFSNAHKTYMNKEQIKTMLKKTVASDIAENITQLAEQFPYPTDKDLIGVSLGFHRLQDFYQINVTDLANGYIRNKNYNLTLSASDCYQIAFHLYYQRFYTDAKLWFLEALQRLPNETGVFKAPVLKIWIIESLAYTCYYADENDENGVKEAVEYVKLALELDPGNKNKENLILSMSNQLKEIRLKNEQSFENTTNAVVEQLPPEYSRWKHESYLIRKICRGDLKKSPTESRNLYCKYERTNHPFLKLAPIKVEILNLDPYVASFHDVIYDNEIEKIQNMSINHLYRATVWNSIKSIGEESHFRTSKVVFLHDESDRVIKNLNQRTEDMTGLSLEHSERLQVMNYGISGHYDVHSDYYPEPDGKTILPYENYQFGNRISTVLFYMSDVEEGGATVYPWSKTLVTPKKGTAAFWFNAFLSGSEDQRSRHCACPVVVGSKWVANKWIRFAGQTFLKRCPKYDDKKNFDPNELFEQIEKNVSL